MSGNKEESIINQVDTILGEAVTKGASDVHIESTAHDARVRFRIDGILYDQEPISESKKSQVVSRIKVLSKINISEKRIPQDGKFKFQKNSTDIDLRVSTFPSMYGEKVVIRILDRSKNMIALHSLGFHETVLEQFVDLIEKSSGFFLVTGPTGSGKTTTLYAALSHLNSPEKNIITLEDPIEYSLSGITQGQIHPDAGFTFGRGIRALLRQDPDVAMVGEVRDKETAQIAIEAALTGHMVFSTLHTNDAAGAIMRLMDMNIEPFLINAALTGVLAQRLARKICDTCRVQVEPNEQEKMIIDRLGAEIDTIYKGDGCDDCLDLGYRGRIGVFELLVTSSDLRALIVEHPKFDDIRSQAIMDGMRTLMSDGISKVKKGKNSIEEPVRVVF